MSVYIIKNHKETALAMGNNGSGFTLVRSNWENMRLFGAGLLVVAKTTPAKPTAHGNLDECIRICGDGAQLVSVAFGSVQDDRHLLGFLEAATGMKIPGSLRHCMFANRKFTQLIASEISADLKKPSVGLFERIYGLFQREPKSEAAFSATGSFTGDLLEILRNPEGYLVAAMEAYASQFPAVRAVFEARDFGIAIGRAMETSLSFEGIVGNTNMKIPDFKKMEDANRDYCHIETQDGKAKDLRKLTAREMDIIVSFTDIHPCPRFVATTLGNLWPNMRKSVIRYVALRVTGLVGGALVQKLFPNSKGLLNLPKTDRQWLEDFGRAASNEIQKKVDEVVRELL